MDPIKKIPAYDDPANPNRSQAIHYLKTTKEKPNNSRDHYIVIKVLAKVREFGFSPDEAAYLANDYWRWTGFTLEDYQKMADPNYKAPDKRPTGETGHENDSSVANTMIGRCRSYLAGFDWGFAFAYHDDLKKCPPMDNIGFSVTQYEIGSKEGIIHGRLARKAEGK